MDIKKDYYSMTLDELQKEGFIDLDSEELLKEALKMDLPILITGNTGCGKNILQRAMLREMQCAGVTALYDTTGGDLKNLDLGESMYYSPAGKSSSNAEDLLNNLRTTVDENDILAIGEINDETLDFVRDSFKSFSKVIATITGDNFVDYFRDIDKLNFVWIKIWNNSRQVPVEVSANKIYNGATSAIGVIRRAPKAESMEVSDLRKLCSKWDLSLTDYVKLTKLGLENKPVIISGGLTEDRLLLQCALIALRKDVTKVIVCDNLGDTSIETNNKLIYCGDERSLFYYHFYNLVENPDNKILVVMSEAYNDDREDITALLLSHSNVIVTTEFSEQLLKRLGQFETASEYTLIEIKLKDFEEIGNKDGEKRTITISSFDREGVKYDR